MQHVSSERGAILINTVLTLVVWFGVTTFVVDYGAMWVSRHQAQNAADAGALAGALARAYDDFDNPPDPLGATFQYATAVANANPVWGVTSPPVITFPCPPEVLAPQRCVRADVYRNGQNGSAPLPLWFGRVLGLTNQGVRATASAQVMIANGTDCLRPWAIPDAWVSGAAPGADFRKYANGSGALIPFGDDYTPPDTTTTGSGFRFATSNLAHNDLGVSLPLTFAVAPTTNADPIVAGWVLPLEPAAGYVASVGACNNEATEIGDQISVSATLPTAADFGGLYAADSTATWDAASDSVHNSCAPTCAPFSPRLVAIAVFDTEVFQYRRIMGWNSCPPGRTCTPCPGGAPCATIVNIVGLFIDNDVTGLRGTLASYPGLVPSTAPKLSADSSFLKAITLVR